MQGKVLHISPKPGMEIKRRRRKKCPDEYMELPPPPALLEVDPVILADIEEAARDFIGFVEKHRKKIPQFWFDMVSQFLTGSFYEYAVNSENDRLIKDTQEKETKIRMGVKLVKR